MKPALVSVVLAQFPARLKKRGLSADELDEAAMTSVLAALKDRRIYREGVLELLERALADRKKIEDLWPAPADDAKVRANIRATAENMKGRRFRREAARELLAMGRLMDEWRGRVDGAELAARLKEELEGTSR
jgi:Glu-tRNA(Gln) amidotransferase subunit E-like FAD-binding protein